MRPTVYSAHKQMNAGNEYTRKIESGVPIRLRLTIKTAKGRFKRMTVRIRKH